jgi:hypothetical protein
MLQISVRVLLAILRFRIDSSSLIKQNPSKVLKERTRL